MTCAEQYNTSACSDSRYSKSKHEVVLDDYELLDMHGNQELQTSFFAQHGLFGCFNGALLEHHG